MSKGGIQNVSHIGISVPTLKGCGQVYTEVMGWYLIMEPTEIVKMTVAIGEMCTEVLAMVGKFLYRPHVTA